MNKNMSNILIQKNTLKKKLFILKNLYNKFFYNFNLYLLKEL